MSNWRTVLVAAAITLACGTKTATPTTEPVPAGSTVPEGSESAPASMAFATTYERIWAALSAELQSR